jgi:hypothetical protein
MLCHIFLQSFIVNLALAAAGDAGDTTNSPRAGLWSDQTHHLNLRSLPQNDRA